METKFILCCTDLGVHRDGANLGPFKVFENLDCKKDAAVFINKLNVVKSLDKKDLAKNLDAINVFTNEHFNVCLETIDSGFFPLTIGGDHSCVIGSILGSNTLNHDIGVIWIDAHGDYNNFATTETGNIHGFPLAAVTDYGCRRLTDFLDCEYVNPKKCVIVGARSVDLLEGENIKTAGVTMFTMDDIKKYGIKYIMDESFKIAGSKVHVSYDIDGIDPLIAPGVTTDVAGGLSYDDMDVIMKTLIDNNSKIVSMDVVEFNPLNDVDDKTLNITLDIVNSIVSFKK